MPVHSKMEKTNKREYADCVQGRIKLPYPLPLIIDLPEFQHLRRVAQLGAVSFVYPSCEHSRFPHSLGVCDLALKFVRRLQEIRMPLGADPVTESDCLAVALAGLAHDLGHGPFSHAYDQCFISHFHPESKWKHEIGSVDMLKHIFKKYPDVKKAFDQYFTAADYEFVYELINPPKNLINDNGEWQMKGRPMGKSYLWEIVSNPLSGFDVDKLDYMKRDSMMSTFTVSIDDATIERIKNNMHVSWKRDQYGNKMWHIFYKKKLILDIERIMQARAELHEVVYRHKTSLAINGMILKIMIECNDYYKIKGTNGYVRLSEAYSDMEALQRTSDVAILDFVRNSIAPELETARQILENLEFRRLPHRVYGYKTATKPEQEEIDRINEIIHEEGQKLNIPTTAFFHESHNFNQGKGANSPLKFINFSDGGKHYTLSPFDIRGTFGVCYYITYFYMDGHLSHYDEISHRVSERLSPEPEDEEEEEEFASQNPHRIAIRQAWVPLATIVFICSLLSILQL